MSLVGDLNSRFADTAGVRFCLSEEIYPQCKESLPVMVVENSLARLVLALNGAHVISYAPAGGKDILWFSPNSRMAEGVPIRGGIPLCFPWFGPHPDGFPMHGFARIVNWNADQIEVVADGATRIRLGLSDTPSTRALWPHAFTVQYEILVGRQLRLELTARNLDAGSARVEFAFHTYFNVGDVKQTKVEGLEGCAYIDREHGNVRKHQQGAVTIEGATQNLYLGVPSIQSIKCPAGNYRIEGDSRSALVWNAGDNDRNVPDLGAGNHKGYVCVERVDAGESAVELAPNQSYCTVMTLARE